MASLSGTVKSWGSSAVSMASSLSSSLSSNLNSASSIASSVGANASSMAIAVRNNASSVATNARALAESIGTNATSKAASLSNQAQMLASNLLPKGETNIRIIQSDSFQRFRAGIATRKLDIDGIRWEYYEFGPRDLVYIPLLFLFFSKFFRRSPLSVFTEFSAKLLNFLNKSQLSPPEVIELLPLEFHSFGRISIFQKIWTVF